MYNLLKKRKTFYRVEVKEMSGILSQVILHSIYPPPIIPLYLYVSVSVCKQDS